MTTLKLPQPTGRSLGVAPMEGVTVLPTRLFFHLAGQPAWQATPFLRVTATHPARQLPAAFAPEIETLTGSDGQSLLPYRLVPQLMATEADDFLRAAALFSFGPATPFLELNAGCPSPTCVGKGAGSSLLRDPDDFHAMIERLASRLGPGRLAVKMRTGFHDANEFPGLLRGLAALPLARLTVHGRTRADAYKGQARWDLIHHASTHTATPVVGSGDVVDADSLTALYAAAPGLAGVIVGRGSLRNPWLFDALRTGHAVDLSPTALSYALVVFALLCELYPDRLPELFELIGAGWFTRPCGRDGDAWQDLAARLMQRVYGSTQGLKLDGASLPTARSPHTLGRVKMLWNYLRSSLPARFFEPTLLRHRELGAFLSAVVALCRQETEATGEAMLPLRYNPTWNWLYAGEKRPVATSSATPAALDPQAGCGLSLSSSNRVQAASQASTMADSASSSV